MTVRPTKPDRSRRTGTVAKVSFPVATAAAQSTVSLAALFPERARLTESPTFGGYGTTGGLDTPPPPGVPTKAGREYYRPRSWATHATDTDPQDEPSEGPASEGRNGSVLNGSGPARDRNGAPMPDLGAAGTPIDPTVVPEATGDEPKEETVPGIRLSPILRLVEHPSGLRAQFRVGGPVAAAIAEVMIPAIEAAASTRPASGRTGDSATGRGGPEGRLGFLRLGRRLDKSGTAASRGAGRPAASPLSISELVRRSVVARRENDLAAARAVEDALCSLHRHPFTPLRPPTTTPMVPVTPAEEEAIRHKALVSVGATEKGLSKAEVAHRKALAGERVDALVRAINVARAVFAGRRQALADGGWSLLRGHDPATVVAVVDDALRLSGSDVTCLDAGVRSTTQRAYVTVLVRFAPMMVVGDDGLEESASGRPVWRARTPWERNGVYAAGLASAVVAAAKQVDCVALAADDVNVVVVRPSRNGRTVEPIYVGTLDREDVSLRHPDADPMPLVVASAVPHGIRIHGPDREVTALDRAADVDGALREIVSACRAAMESRPDGEASGDKESDKP